MLVQKTQKVNVMSRSHRAKIANSNPTSGKTPKLKRLKNPSSNPIFPKIKE